MNNQKNYNYTEVVDNIMFEGRFINVQPYGSGHINDTFVAYFEKEKGQRHRYILQRINNYVFKDPEKLMENIQNTTAFLRKKITEEGGDPDRETLNVIPSVKGKSYYKDDDGNYWRGYIFIEGAQTYQIVEKPQHLYYTGKALGKFQKYLSDFPAQSLHETIPDFHNTRKRFNAFVEAVEKDSANHVKGVKKEIEFVMRRESSTEVLINLIKNGDLQLRVTHNDTKFNNVMIDDVTGEGICVIDLDTVMPGLILYDFGDSIRSGANPAAEDERDLSKVSMDISLYENFTCGFLEETKKILHPLEIEYLPFSAKLMTFECGIRFLTDYLNGDSYFKIHREDHNLDRARTQFRIVEDMESKMETMKKIVSKYL